MRMQVAFFPLLLISAWAGTGAITESQAPEQRGTISIADNRLTAVGVNLAEAVQALQPRMKIKVAPEIAQRRYDLDVQATPGETLTEALKRSLREDLGMQLSWDKESVPVWVFRPTGEPVQPMKPYPPAVPKGHFSCRSCSVADLGAALERGLGTPVLFEPKDLILSDVMVQWLDQPSLLAAVQTVLGLRGSTELREMPVIAIAPVPEH